MNPTNTGKPTQARKHGCFVLHAGRVLFIRPRSAQDRSKYNGSGKENRYGSRRGIRVYKVRAYGRAVFS